MSGVYVGRKKRHLACVGNAMLQPPFVHVPRGTSGTIDVEHNDAGRAATFMLSDFETWEQGVLENVLFGIRGCLMPGGVLRVATEDIDRVVHGYLAAEEHHGGGPSRAQTLASWFARRRGAHVFNEEDLVSLLRKTGFVSCQRFVAGSGSEPVFWNLDMDHDKDLIIEARRPLPGSMSWLPT
jgi:hypothetical protein